MSQKHSILTLTIAAAAAVSAMVFVDYTGAIPAAGGHTAGVTRTSGNAADLLPVDVLGTAVVTAGAAIAVGQRVMSDANGNAIPWVAGAAPAVNYVAGVALEASLAAGQTIEVALIPN